MRKESWILVGGSTTANNNPTLRMSANQRCAAFNSTDHNLNVRKGRKQAMLLRWHSCRLPRGIDGRLHHSDSRHAQKRGADAPAWMNGVTWKAGVRSATILLFHLASLSLLILSQWTEDSLHWSGYLVSLVASFWLMHCFALLKMSSDAETSFDSICCAVFVGGIASSQDENFAFDCFSLPAFLSILLLIPFFF